MQRASCLISGLISACVASLAFAGDIPLPIKKPRDKTGAVITQPDVAAPHTPAAAPAPVVTKSAAEAAKAVQHNAAAAAHEDAKKDAAAKEHKGEPGKAEKPATATATPAATPATPAVPPIPPVPPVPKEWSPQEIEAAKAHCTDVLKGIDAVSVPEPSFRDGECGAPAAVRLISIGKNPQVSLSPPALLTCDMVVGLHTWMKQDVQRLAKKHLGSQIIKIETMSDYACRNAYGRTGNKLSEHGHANALDIRGFVTAAAKTAYVLESWGQTQREIAAQIAAVKAAEDKARAIEAAATAKAAEPSTPASAPSTGSAAVPVPALRSSQDAGPDATSLGYQPAHLGGPKDKDKTAKRQTSGKTKPEEAPLPVLPATPEGLVKPAEARTAAFLHDAHDAACQIFGTTLGPEANKDHRNHFHVDMAPRKTKKICD